MVANVHKDGSETIYFINFGDDDDQSFLGLLCWGPSVFFIKKNAINIIFVYHIMYHLSNMSPIFLFSFPLYSVTYLNFLYMSLHLTSN